MIKLNHLFDIVTVLTIAATPILSNAKEALSPYSGLYAGVDLGGSWGSSKYQTNSACSLTPGGGTFCSVGPSEINGLAVTSNGSGKLNLTGFDLSGHIGYNWTLDPAILGLEVDFGWFNLSKFKATQETFPVAFLGNTYVLTESLNTSWLGTLRGRIGIELQPQLLLYTTAGLAFTDFQFSSSYIDNAVGFGFPGGAGTGSLSKNVMGWTLGVGSECLISSRYSIKAEYLYVDFNSITVPVPISNTAAFTQVMQINADLKTNVIRIGLNYWF